MADHGDSTSGLRTTVLLILALTGFAALLSVPAILYAWKNPSTANVLSLVLTFGFFVAVGLLVRSRVALVLLGGIVLGLNLIEIVSLVSFGGLVSLGGLQAILYVDPTEAREFVGDHAGAIGAGLAIIPIFVGLVLAKARYDRLSWGRRFVGATSALLVPAVFLTGELVARGSPDDIYLPTRIFEHYVAYLGANPTTSTISGIATTLAAQREFEAQRDRRAALHFDVTRVAPAGRELYVVVVGESSRRRNWGIYGYGRDTTPRLRDMPGLTVFRDAVSPGTVTGISVPRSFYFPTAAGDGGSQVSNSFVTAFRAAGFKTFWLSNQGTHRSAVGGQISLLMDEAEVVDTTNYGFWNTVLDGALLDAFDRALSDPAERKLVVVHTLGSHTNYRQRYPADWAQKVLEPAVREVHTTSELSAADAEVVDEYDRSILYTDWLIAELIARTRATESNGALVYFSDHGQRLYDDASHAKGHGFGDFKGADVEIPLLVWTSDAFARANPGKRDAIAASACRPVSTGAIAASMLDLAGITVREIAPTPSLFVALASDADRRVTLPDERVVSYATAERRAARTGCSSRSVAVAR